MQPNAEDLAAARALVERASKAALSTIALRPAGYPFATLVAVAHDDRYRPLLLLSKLAEHTKNLEADPRASLLFADDGASDPLAAGRVTLTGSCARIEGEDAANARELYLAKHPLAAQWVAFADFGFFRLEPDEIRFVAGFGRMGWIPKDAFATAASRSSP